MFYLIRHPDGKLYFGSGRWTAPSQAHLYTFAQAEKLFQTSLRGIKAMLIPSSSGVPAPESEPGCLNFICPQCDQNPLAEASKTSCRRIREVGQNGTLSYYDSAVSGQDNVRYGCLNCGWRVPGATNGKQLAEALRKHEEAKAQRRPPTPELPDSEIPF